MKIQKSVVSLFIGLACTCGPVLAQEAPETLITNARIFDGNGSDLIEGKDVLIQDGMIAAIGADLDAPEGATKIDASGLVMTPGFIDVHYHLGMCRTSVNDMAGSYAPDLDYIGISASIAAQEALMRGFTSLRDVGGASWGAKLASDRNEIAGPRIWPSLRVISQFGGHGDGSPRFLAPREFGGPENYLERVLYSRIVNGRDAVLTAARENLKNGASQLKMHLAGGVGTEFDPIDASQFTPDEIRAAVDADNLEALYSSLNVARSELRSTCRASDH